MTLRTSDTDDAAQNDQSHQRGGRTRSIQARVETTRAERIVTDLVEAGYVDPLPEIDRFIHRPTNERFRSAIRLTAYHQGWVAAQLD